MSPTDLIRRAVLRWLTRRDYSLHELQQKLQAKGYSLTDSEPILQHFVQAGYINERRFAESFVYWRSNRGYGPLRISMELQAKGIHAEMIADLVEITDNAWVISAKKSWQKHFKGRLPRDFNEKVKQMRFLQYRGFTREQIEQVLDSELD